MWLLKGPGTFIRKETTLSLSISSKLALLPLILFGVNNCGILFQGQFRSVVTCMTCSKQSVTFEAFMYLTVPIPKGGNKPTIEVVVKATLPCNHIYVLSVKDCIKLFARPEKMEGTNKWLVVYHSLCIVYLK